MEQIFLEAKVMWSQIDANMHLRHSAYADFAAQARVEMLESLGMDAAAMKAYHIGPVLFREETIYLREVRPGDRVKISCALSKCREDGSRWSFEQMIYRGDGVVAAKIIVDGAWIDMEKRKLTAPPEAFNKRFLESLPRTDHFTIEPLTGKEKT